MELLKNKLLPIIVIVFVLGVGLGFSLNVSAEESLIPSWIKSTAGFWVEGQIGDTEFLSALQFLVKEGILIIPEEKSAETTTEIKPKNTVESSIFPDPNKDPRYYLERYYTEPAYKDWYDDNYPNISIEDKVGYSSVIVSDDAYINNLFGFAFTPPFGWIKTENPETVDANIAGIVSFDTNANIPECDYGPNFIVHYFKDEPVTRYDTPESLLNAYESIIYFEESSQTKLIDTKIERLSNGFQIIYFFNDVGLFPEVELYDGTICPEEFFSLQNVYVVFLYDNGDRYDLIFSSEPDFYNDSIVEFEKSIETFKTGTKFEKISSILNYD